MTNYLASQQINIDGFLNASQNQIKIATPNGTTNLIENPSFEMPTYDPPTGTLLQWNWSYTASSGYVYPVTFEHAYSGSFAWKIRMPSSSTVIRYGTERLINPTTEEGYQDILSFYYYGVVDAKTSSYSVTDYGNIIGEQTGNFIVNLYGSNNALGSSSVLVSSKEFTVKSLPKSDPGDLDNGISGSMVPHFYKWNRFVWVIPEDIKSYRYAYFEITRTNSAADIDYNFYLVVDAFQWEKQPYGTLETMYFDGSFDGFNTRQYPMSFQWTGSPHKSMSIRSHDTRSNGLLMGIADYCNFFVKSINGIEVAPEDTKLFTKTMEDGQYFVEQITQSRQLSISGRIIADTEAEFFESFARLQELLGKKPYAQPEPVRMVFELSFTTGIQMVPIYLDVVYATGLELDTSNVFQSDIELNLAVISNGLLYQGDSSSNMFNDRPLFDQFNTMEVSHLRDVAGLFYFNKAEQNWESPSNIGFFIHNEHSYTSALPYGGTGLNQIYETKDSYAVGNVNVIKEDKDGIVWFGGRFDIVEVDGFYVYNGVKNTVKLRVHVNNIVGLRKRAMSGQAFVYPSAVGVTNIENGPDLVTVTYHTDWQIIPLLDIPTRYSLSNEFSPLFVGLKGSSVVNAIEITPDGTMYIGGDFDFDYGTRHFGNFLAFTPYGSDAQNVNLYIPEHSYSFVSVNFNSTTLVTNLGRGRRRTEWVNGAIPYCKYGMFTEVGHIGPPSHSGVSAVYDIKYDDINGCLYIGGTFCVVSNTYEQYNSFGAARFVQYDILAKKFINMGTTYFGVDHTNGTPSNSVIVRKILVQYTAEGVNVYVVGKFSTIGQVSDNIPSVGIGLFYVSTKDHTTAYPRSIGGGATRNDAGSDIAADLYDIVSTSDQRVYVAGNFDAVNKDILPKTKVSCFAEIRNGLLVDVTRGLEANYAPDYYQTAPVIYKMSVDSSDNIYLAGGFSNVKNRFQVDGIAKWDGTEFSGMGISFRPRVPKTLQSVYVDRADNVFVFTGPNQKTTAITRTMFNDITFYTRPTSIDVAWTNLSSSALKEIFGQSELNLEFLCINYDVAITYSTGYVHSAVRLDSSIKVGLPTYASKDIIFIGGRFDYVRMGDIYFRVNNLVAFEYDENVNPFPYKVLTFSPGYSPYYDRDANGENAPSFGINTGSRRGVTNGAIFSIDVKVTNVGGNYIPTDLFVGGRFDFTAKNVRYKNFVHIALEQSDDNTWIKYNIPTNDEARLSVPYMNYATWYTPGLCGVDGQNDAVYAVKASAGTWAFVSRTDPNIVIIGGDFFQVTSNNADVGARRVAIYTISTGWHTSLNVAHRFYKINFGIGTGTPQGVQPSTAYSADIYVKSIEYVPWYYKAVTTWNSLAIIMGKFTFTDPFICGSSTISTGNPIVKFGIVPSTGSNLIPEAGVVTTAFTGSPVYFNSSDYNNATSIYVVGQHTAASSSNFHRLGGSYSTASTISINVVATSNWPNIYQSNLGIPYVPTHVYLNKSQIGTIYVTGAETDPGTLFVDAIVLKQVNFNYLQAANYAYANVNLPQVVTTVNSGTDYYTVDTVQRRYRQYPSYNVGHPMPIQTASQTAGAGRGYTVSIPTHGYQNTLYDANIMQTFNCYNNGTLSVYPTISLYCPFAGDVDIDPYLHVITNVTTGQSLHLALTLQPGEIIRIRTQKERISVISNIKGDLTNVILSSRNIRGMKIDNAQIFRLVPGKNVIRYGPSFPVPRYFRSGSPLTSKIVYNMNQNVVVPPIIITMDWQMAFNSVHDALFTHTNPLLLR